MYHAERDCKALQHFRQCACTVNPLNPPRLAVSNRRVLGTWHNGGKLQMFPTSCQNEAVDHLSDIIQT